MRNISTNISALGRRTHLKLGELSFLFIVYNITIFWLCPLHSFWFYFLLRDSAHTLLPLIELRIQVDRHLTPSIQKCMCANSQFVVNSSSIISIIIWSVTPNVRIFDRGTPLNNRTLFAVYVTTFLQCIASCAPLPHQPPTQTPFGLVTQSSSPANWEEDCVTSTKSVCVGSSPPPPPPDLGSCDYQFFTYHGLDVFFYT